MKTLVSHRAHDARCEAKSEKMLAEAVRLADILHAHGQSGSAGFDSLPAFTSAAFLTGATTV